MDSYTDIKLQADPETNVNQLRALVYEKLHFALANMNSAKIGVSFPQVKARELGSVLRLHGHNKELSQLLAADWMVRLRDYLTIGSIHGIPGNAMYRQVRRAQSKSNPARLRRRLMKRHNLSVEEALAQIPDSAERFLDLPFVMMRSHSTKQRFRLFLSHGPLSETPVSGDFNSYGLSSTATIPWF